MPASMAPALHKELKTVGLILDGRESMPSRTQFRSSSTLAKSKGSLLPRQSINRNSSGNHHDNGQSALKASSKNQVGSNVASQNSNLLLGVMAGALLTHGNNPPTVMAKPTEDITNNEMGADAVGHAQNSQTLYSQLEANEPGDRGFLDITGELFPMGNGFFLLMGLGLISLKILSRILKR